MNITLHLHTTLQKKTQQGLINKLDLALPDGMTLADLVGYLDMEIDPEHTLLVINTRIADLEQILRDGDDVHFIPAISGG